MSTLAGLIFNFQAASFLYNALSEQIQLVEADSQKGTWNEADFQEILLAGS